MKGKRKITLLVLGLILLFVALVVTISSLIKYEESPIQEVAKLTKEALAVNGSVADGTLVTQGAHDSPAFYQNGSFYYEALPSQVNKVFCPSIGDIQLYCIQKGVSVEMNENLVATIRALDGTTGSVSSGSHKASLPAKRYSNTYYICVNNHTELVPSGAYTVTAPNNFIAPTDGTYVYGKSTTYFEKGENISQEVKQVAIWLNMEVNQGETFEASGAKFTYLDMAEQLKEESMDYRDYEAELQNNVNNPIQETTTEKVKINVNQEEQYLIIGPYKMDYVEGNSASAKFAGISNMTVKGYNDKDKTQYIKDANIISYIQNGEEKELDFFTPLEEQGYVDRTEQSYPVSGQEFYLKIENPNQGVLDSNDVVRYLDIEVEYSYMTTYAIACRLEGHQLVATPIETGHHDSHGEDGDLTSCTVNYRWKVTEYPVPQQFMMDAWGERNLYKLTIHLTGGGDQKLDITMNLGGYVWEDVKDTKQNIADGIHSDLYTGEANDRVLPNVKVTLYECPLDKNGNLQYRNGKLVSYVADLLSEADKESLTDREIAYRMNPTLTDENGYYEFDGLNPESKYYVTFEYNGQIYLPTEYLVTDQRSNGNFVQQDSVTDMVYNAQLYNTEIWEATSKITELQDGGENDTKLEMTREEYNEQFEEIGSAPKNYISSNSLRSGELVRDGRNYYNEAYSIYDLMGFTLNEDGEYEQTEVQLIDGFYEIDRNGNIIETEESQEGEISKQIQRYMDRYLEYPDERAMLDIYEDIVNDFARTAKQKEELWKKLQFIEDCKMQAYTGSPLEDGAIDLYPVYDDFVIDNKKMVIPGVGTKPPIYDGQYYVNAGLWRRQENNLSLRKDIYRAATKINGKTEVYEYDKRSEEDSYWEIQIRMQDYYNYYGTNYNRELYPADYEYRAENTNLYGSNLELYVTYKITIRNSSQNILNEITEVVDYYDKDYTYMPDLSWVMYKDSNSDGNEKVAITDESYYNMIHNLDLSQITYARNINSSYGITADRNGNYCGDSIYGDASKEDIEEELNSVYIRGLDGKKLATGENAYIYLTFKVNADDQGPVILDNDQSLKENFAEINGYESYYADGEQLPNKQTIRNNRTPAGIIDYNSTPGNLSLDDLQGEKYEKNFEDDTDRAKSIKVYLEQSAIRKINGTVWEDERTKNISESVLGDGIRQEGEIGIAGVMVELVETMEDGKEYVWQTTTTDENGYYEFSSFIPGNYVVRFQYGNNQETVLTTNNGGKNAVSYNGQDFKSTVYQQDLQNNQSIANYTDEYYDIQKADELSANGETNLSDAKDLWENQTINTGRTQNNQTTYQNETYQGRTNVNAYSTSNVNNHKAEVLASPYMASMDNSLVQELMQNTHMTAQTAVIVIEGEYNRTNTDGLNDQSNGSDSYLYGNDKNGNYTLNCVDFGLTERPKAQLTLDKKVSNVKITLANGNIAFDASQTVPNLIWVSGKPYDLSSKMDKNKYEEYYEESKQDANYNRYSYRTEIDKLIASLYQSGQNGLIQPILDAELMHGATIQIAYELTVTNAGETDYTGQDFYYKATGASEENKVTTTANLVLDYVANNLQYREADNEGWKVVTENDLTNNDNAKVNDRLVNNSLTEQIGSYNTILQTDQLSSNLKPGEEVSKQLILTQLITSSDSQDDKTYENIAEIVQTSNTAGRRMAYSVVGNQDPTQTPSEVDSSRAEKVTVLPPFGQAYLYYGIGILVGILLIAGIVVIKKKVMKK